MLRHVCTFVVLALATGHAVSQTSEETRADKLRAQIADLKAKLAALEAELRTSSARPTDDISPARPFALGGNLALRVGDYGNFGKWRYEVERVRDAKTAELSIGGGRFVFLVTGASTAGLVDSAKVRMMGNWKVTGTKTIFGRTMHVVEAADGAAIVDVDRADREDARAAAEAKAEAADKQKRAEERAVAAFEAGAEKAVAAIRARLEAGTEPTLHGAMGEYFRRKQVAEKIRHELRSLSDGRNSAVVTWTPAEMKSATAATAEKAKAAPFGGSPARLGYQVAADFEYLNGHLVFQALRFQGGRFEAGGAGPPASHPARGWFQLLDALPR
jgi:hypothetical protein